MPWHGSGLPPWHLGPLQLLERCRMGPCLHDPAGVDSKQGVSEATSLLTEACLFPVGAHCSLRGAYF